MKIERAQAKFEPITITLETEEETRALMTAVGCINNGGVSSAAKFYDGVYHYLYNKGFELYNTEGSLKIVGN